VVVAAVAILLALALVAGIVVLVVRDDDPRAASPGPARPSVGSTTTAPADELQAAVRELSDFVARRRGRPFEHQVDVELLDDDAFVDRLRKDEDEDKASVEESERLLRAVGLLDGDDDLVRAVDRATEEGVLGFYDPKEDALVVRGSDLSAGVRSTLVHELTHAWDDQHFELDRPALDEADDESGFGFSALVEGNATRVEDAWRDSLSGEDQAELRSDDSSAADRLDTADVPQIVLQLLTLPYVAGSSLTETLASAGGEQRVDAAFRAPPTTSEQVLDPTKYVAGAEPAVSVPEPAADGPVQDRGVYGAAGVLLTLVDHIATDDAQRAAQGWGGDRYVTWAAGERTCVRIAFAGDDPGDVRELRSAWSDWADEADRADVREVDGRVVVTSCG
jgi:hypothetical protein